MGALRSAVIEGNVKSGSLMAGQSVGLLTKPETVQEIIDDLVAESEKEFNHVKSMLA
jgi:enoyl-[acyl-carrier protein] reductase II